jgi:hypothetical protein
MGASAILSIYTLCFIHSVKLLYKLDDPALANSPIQCHVAGSKVDIAYAMRSTVQTQAHISSKDQEVHLP